MRVKNIIISLVLGLLFWLGMNSSLEKGVLIAGIVVAVIVTAFSFRSPVLGAIRITPRALFSFVIWLLVFIVELVKSNIDVMFRVVTPRVRIKPAIVEVKTKLKSPIGRLALANSITLTPGTLTTDIEGDRLYIHWIDAASTDVEAATDAIVAKFEKHLEVVFG